MLKILAAQPRKQAARRAKPIRRCRRRRRNSTGSSRGLSRARAALLRRATRTPERRSIAQPDLGPAIEPPDYEPAGYRRESAAAAPDPVAGSAECARQSASGRCTLAPRSVRRRGWGADAGPAVTGHGRQDRHCRCCGSAGERDDLLAARQYRRRVFAACFPRPRADISDAAARSDRATRQDPGPHRADRHQRAPAK